MCIVQASCQSTGQRRDWSMGVENRRDLAGGVVHLSNWQHIHMLNLKKCTRRLFEGVRFKLVKRLVTARQKKCFFIAWKDQTVWATLCWFIWSWPKTRRIWYFLKGIKLPPRCRITWGKRQALPNAWIIPHFKRRLVSWRHDMSGVRSVAQRRSNAAKHRDFLMFGALLP